MDARSFDSVDGEGVARLGDWLDAFYAVAGRLTGSAGADGVLLEVARGLGRALPRVGEVSIAEWDARRGVIRDVLEFRPWTNRRVPLPPPAVHSVEELPELVSLLAGDRRHVLSVLGACDTSPGQAAYMQRWGWKTLLQVPLVADGRTLGVVEIVDPLHATDFTRAEIKFCEALAATGAGALRQAQLYERVRRLADHDALTGLANARTFRRKLAAALRSTAHGDAPVSLLVLDIDDFKLVNDRHGHARGDGVLRAAARLLTQHRRRSDTVGRLGGDEFGLAALNTPPDAAAALSTRLLTAFLKDQIAVSIGVATHTSDSQTATKLIHAADLALLEAKRAGKQRFRTAA